MFGIFGNKNSREISDSEKKAQDKQTEAFGKVWSHFIDVFVDTCVAQGGTVSDTKQNSLLQKDNLKYDRPAVDRLIALGDIHGDIGKAKQALRQAHLIDLENNWTGGSSTLVQIGDQLDRGDHETPVLYLLEKLQAQARRSGGEVIIMHGNHEIMNINGRYRYATQRAKQSNVHWWRHQGLRHHLKQRFDCASEQDKQWNQIYHQIEQMQKDDAPQNDVLDFARHKLMQQGTSPFSQRFFRTYPTTVKVGDTVFVHGGLLPKHIDFCDNKLEDINYITQSYIDDPNKQCPPILGRGDAVVWARDYSIDPQGCNCNALNEALQRLNGKRMIIGHTIQPQGINTACNGKAIRVDVGMSKGCRNSSPELIEIIQDKEIYKITSEKRIQLDDQGQEIQGPKSFWEKFFAKSTNQ